MTDVNCIHEWIMQQTDSTQKRMALSVEDYKKREKLAQTADNDNKVINWL